MQLTRLSGILLHPTSLPGPHGSGDLGPSAYHFIDWLVVSRQSLWQVLPLTDVGVGNSPYMSPSAFAGNILLIDLDQLRQAGWLDESDLHPDVDFPVHRVDFASMIPFRMARLRKAATRFFDTAKQHERAAFDAFCVNERAWLDDYALFLALEQTHGETVAWQDWPAALAKRDRTALREAMAVHTNEIHFLKFSQWQFFEQWARLKTYANARGIDIAGDIPIFVAPHSVDVWANPHLFELDVNGHPTVVAGVPPDKFSDSGQLWGNPLYRWAAHTKDGFQWWTERMRRAQELFDWVRIDHFRGFESYWEVPVSAKSAIAGKWRPGPKSPLFVAMRKQLGELRVIAEDLGVITPEVHALRKELNFPGMRILQFAFGSGADNPYLPHNYASDTVVYTGTHDNDTTRGWWQSLPEYERDFARRYLSVNGDWIHWDLIRTAQASVAAFAISPMQDVLGLDAAHRMNRPGEASGSWEWRFHWGQVDNWFAGRLAEMAVLYGRCRTVDAPPTDATAERDKRVK